MSAVKGKIRRVLFERNKARRILYNSETEKAGFHEHFVNANTYSGNSRKKQLHTRIYAKLSLRFFYRETCSVKKDRTRRIIFLKYENKIMAQYTHINVRIIQVIKMLLLRFIPLRSNYFCELIVSSTMESKAIVVKVFPLDCQILQTTQKGFT